METVEFEFLSGNKVMFLEKIITLEDFHLSHIIINFDENGSIKITENEEAALSILYSIQFRKFIRYKFCCLELTKALAIKWVAPEWLIYQINEQLYKKNPEFLKICKNCNISYKDNENCLNSCVFHPENFNMYNSIYECCGFNNSCMGCRRGYHNDN